MPRLRHCPECDHRSIGNHVNVRKFRRLNRAEMSGERVGVALYACSCGCAR
jgi:hypothetical protein